jgi:hypothetical protein
MSGGLSWFLVTDVSMQPIGPIPDGTDNLSLKMAQKGCPETSRHALSQKSAKAWGFIVSKPSFVQNTLTFQVMFFWVMTSCRMFVSDEPAASVFRVTDWFKWTL